MCVCVCEDLRFLSLLLMSFPHTHTHTHTHTHSQQNTMKLVAMNLIASGKLMEGVELLCLIGNGLDACRYLQTYGRYDLASR